MTFKTLYKILAALLCLPLAFGCSDDPAYSSDYDIQWPVPTISSISPSTGATVSSNLTITGTGLDKITAITIDSRTMSIVEKTPTTLTATLPRKFNASMLTLTNLYRQTVKSATPIAPQYPAVVIADFPGQIVKGQPFVITGTNLDLITSIIVGSSVVAVSSSNATTLSVPTLGLGIKAGEKIVLDVKSTFSEVTNGQSPEIDVVN